MTDVFNRPMFNNPNNVRRMQNGGILASSPDLIEAVKKLSQNRFTAIPMLNQQIPTQDTLSGFKRTMPFTAINTAGAVPIDDVGIDVTRDISRRIMDDPTRFITTTEDKKSRVVDTSLENKPKEVKTDTTAGSETDKFGVKKLKPILANFKKDTENIDTPDKNETDSSLFDTSKDIELTNNMMARNRRALTDMASLDDKQFLGTSANQTQKDLIAELKKKGKEITLADVRDKAISILGFDPEKIEENFDEDRRSALFLRVMQAGLAVAAGESDNPLTNIAKGLNVGLSGYGDDVKFLTKEMKADRREAANTMYKLLGDAKSEQIAKETLALKKKMNINQILTTKVGQEKDILIKQVELQNANDTLKLNFIKSMRDLDFKEKKFEVEQEQFEQSLNATLRKLPSEEVRQLFEAGLVTLTDQSKGLIPGNYTVSTEGKEILKGVIKDEFGGKVTDKKQFRLSMGKSGFVEGITNPNFEFGDDGNLKNKSDIVDMGVIAEALNDTAFKKLIQDENYREAGTTLMTLAKNRGFKIDISKLNPMIKEALGKRTVGQGENLRTLDESLLGDPVFFDSTAE